MSQRTLVIANPMSGNGATGRRWRALEERLRAALGPLEIEATRAPRDATRLAREGVRAGIERVVVAGGDGTLHEVVNGLLSTHSGQQTALGLLPLGTGGDFARSLGLPRKLDAALDCIARGRLRQVDAGRVAYRASDGGERTSYFANIASLGISALAVELVNGAPKAFGARAPFAIGAVRAFFRYRCEPVTLRVDGELVHEGPLVLATAANGRYFGGGMQVAPEARLDDGQLDVVVISELSSTQLLRRLPSIYRGAHLADAAVSLHRGRVIEADAPAGRVGLEADGEPIGALPVRFEVLPGALQVLCPNP